MLQSCSVLCGAYCSPWLYFFQSCFKMYVIKVTNIRRWTVCTTEMLKGTARRHCGGKEDMSFFFIFMVMKYSNISHCTVKSNLKSKYTFMCHKIMYISESLPMFFNRKYDYFWLNSLYNIIFHMYTISVFRKVSCDY